MPVYYVLCETVRGNSVIFIHYNILQILKVIECNIDDINKYWSEYAMPLINQGRNVQGYIFVREPNNPFKEFNQHGNEKMAQG